MKKYDFAPIIVRPFPTLTDVRNPWIFPRKVRHLINVANEEDPEIKEAILARGITYEWLPTDERPRMNLPHILLAVRLLRQYDAAGEQTIVHCQAGLNRSPSVVEAYYYCKYHTHLSAEYCGYQNHLIYNCKTGHLPPLEDMEHYLQIL